MHTRRLSAVVLLFLATGCTKLAVPPAVSLPPLPMAALPPTPPRLPADVARVKTPSWLRLEAVWGVTDNLRHPGVVGAAFAPDGRTLVTLGGGGWLRVWDLASHTLRAEIDTCAVASPTMAYSFDPPGATSFALSPDGLAAVGFGGGKVCVVEIRSGRRIRTIDAHQARIVSVAFGGGGLASYAYQKTIIEEAKTRPIVTQRAAGGEARWWDPRTGARLAEANIGPRAALALSSDGARLAATSGKGVGVFGTDGRLLWERADVSGQITFSRMHAGTDTLLVAGKHGLLALSTDTGARGSASVYFLKYRRSSVLV